MSRKKTAKTGLKVTDLDFYNLLRRQAEESRLFFNERRALIFDMEAIGALRQQLIATLGTELASGVLARFGYAQGYGDARTLKENFEWETEADWLAAGPAIHMLEGIVHVMPEKLEFDRASGYFHGHGVWRNSYEAEEHLKLYGRSDQAVCWSLTGYASGYASYFFGREVLAIETECMGKGDGRCYWELRPVEAWGAEAEPYLKALEAADVAKQMAEVNRQLQEQVAQTQAALAKVEQQQRTLQAILEHLPVGVFVADAKTGLPQLVNKAGVALIGQGVDPNQRLDESLEISPIYIPGSERLFPAQDQPIVRVMGGEKLARAEMDLVRPGGGRITIEVTAAPILDEAGELVSGLALFQDITERKQADEVLRQQAQIIDQTHDAVILMDSTGYIKSWNKGAEKLFGYVAEEMLFRHFSFLFPEEGATNWKRNGWEEMIELLSQKEQHEVEIEMQRSSGAGFYAHLSLSLLRNQTGEPIGMIGYFIDISERKRAEEALARQAIELQTVAEVSAAVSSILETKELLQRVVDLTKERFNLYHAQIYLYDEVEETLVLTVGAGEVGRQMVAEGWRIPLEREQSLVAQAGRSRQGIVVNDIGQEPGFLANPLLPETRAEMAAPMIVGEQVLGVLDVQADRVNHFTEEEVRVQTTLAAQVAAALQRASLFEEAQQARLLLGERVKELDCLNDIGREAEETPQIPAFLEWVAERVPGGMRYPEDCRVAIEYEGQVYGQPKAIKLAQQMVHALRVNHEVIGRIYIAYSKKRDFVNEESMLLGGVARRVSAYLENRHLFGQMQEALAETARLYHMGRQINEASDVQEVVAAMAEVAPVAAINRAVLAVFERDGEGEVETVTVVANWHNGQGTHPTPVGTRYTRAMFGRGGVLLSPEPLFFDDIRHDPQIEARTRQVLGQLNIQAMAVLPLWVGTRQVGVLLLEAEGPYQFSERETRSYLSLASQVAVALERARLLEAAQRRAVEMEAVAEVSTVAATILERQKLLQTVVDLTKRNFGLYHAHIYLLNDAEDSLVLAAGAGEIGRQMVGQGWRIWVDEEHSLVARAARSGQSVVANDVQQHPDFLPNPLLPETRAEVAIPLMAGEKLVGVLDVQADRAGRFTEEEVRIKTVLASQVAIALQNARLFAEQQETSFLLIERIKELNCLNEVGRVIGETPPIPELLRWVTERIPAAMQEPEGCVAAIEYGGQLYGKGEAMEWPSQLGQMLRVNGEVVGRVYVAYGEKREFGDEERALVDGIVSRVSGYIENRQLFGQTRLALAEAEQLYLASRRLNEASDLEEIARIVAEEMSTPVINRIVLLLLEEDERGEIEAVTVAANWHNGQGSGPLAVGSRYARLQFGQIGVLLSSEPAFFTDVQHDERVDPASLELLQAQNGQSLAVLPLWIGSRHLGFLTLWSEEIYEFTERESRLYVSLAPQVAVAVDNQRLLSETRTALAEVEAIQRRYTLQAWESYRTKQGSLGYEEVREGVGRLDTGPLPEISQPVGEKRALMVTSAQPGGNGRQEEGNDQPGGEEAVTSLIVPLTIRGEMIGVLGLQETESTGEWMPEEIALVEAIAEQLAQAAENLRLVDETQQRAAREKRVNEIGEKIQAAQSLEEALQIAVKEVGLSLQAPQTTVELSIKS